MTEKSDDPPKSSYISKDLTTPFASTRSLTSGKPMELLYHLANGVVQKLTNNPNAWASLHYSIIEELVEASCVMSCLDDFQSYLM